LEEGGDIFGVKLVAPALVPGVDLEPPTLSDPRLQRTRVGFVRRKRMTMRLCGLSPVHNTMVHDNTIDVLETAIVKRVLLHEVQGEWVKPRLPVKGALGRLNYLSDALCTKLGKFAAMSRQQFVDTYTGRLRTRYDQARQKLDVKGWRPKYAYVFPFVKAEKSIKRLKPRVIQPRRPEHGLEVGRFIRVIEHRVYSGLADLCGGPTVMKGYNALGVAKCICDAWNQFVKPIGLMFDLSAYDQHCSKPYLEYEHAVYTRLFNHRQSRYLDKLLRCQTVNKGYYFGRDGRLRYRVVGGRMSGDMNTALGNCLMVTLVTKCLIDHLGIKARIINAGDDTMIITESHNESLVRGSVDKWFEDYGHICVVETKTARVLEHIDFCQTRPVWNGQAYVMCRNFPNCLDKDTLAVSVPHCWKDHWATVGAGGLALCSGIPVMQEFYKKLMSLSDKRVKTHSILETGMFRLARGMVSDYRPITSESRASFWRAFGVGPDLQCEYEYYYQSIGVGERQLGVTQTPYVLRF
jgi:hypothetical protein